MAPFFCEIHLNGTTTKANKIGGFDIIQRGRVYLLVNKNGDNIIFNQTYKTKYGYFICCNNEMKEEQINNRI